MKAIAVSLVLTAILATGLYFLVDQFLLEHKHNTIVDDDTDNNTEGIYSYDYDYDTQYEDEIIEFIDSLY